MKKEIKNLEDAVKYILTQWKPIVLVVKKKKKNTANENFSVRKNKQK